MSTRIEKGPFGLHKLDFYAKRSPVELCISRRESLFAQNGTYVTVTNAHGLRLADCYFNGTEEEWEQAEQWLRDMVALRSEE